MFSVKTSVEGCQFKDFLVGCANSIEYLFKEGQVTFSSFYCMLTCILILFHLPLT